MCVTVDIVETTPQIFSIFLRAVSPCFPVH
jgi:hypothetical protein